MMILSARILLSRLEVAVVEAGDAGGDAGNGVDDDAGLELAGITGPL